MSDNPFRAPQVAEVTTPVNPDSKFAACPNCSAKNAKAISFSIWGGAVGPKLLTHVKCQSCNTRFNGKTGQSNLTAIIIYQIVVGAIGLVVGIAFFFYFLRR
jgi:ribosomal protein L37AE/L43A